MSVRTPPTDTDHNASTRPPIGLLNSVWLWLLVALLLIVAALRLHHLIDFVEWPDEIYTTWQAKLNLGAGWLLHGDPYWPPLFGGLIWLWMHIAGVTLEASRFISVLFALLGTACVYRATRAFAFFCGSARAQALRAGWGGAFTFATLAYGVFIGVDVRAYGLMLCLMALSIWMTIRWLRQPNWRRSAAVTVPIGLLLNAGFTGLMVIPFLTLFALLLRPRQFWRWVIVGISVLILVAPIIPQFFANNVLGRLNTLRLPPPPLLEALTRIYSEFGGNIGFVAIFGVVLLIVIVTAIRNPRGRIPLLILTLLALSPILMYFLQHDKDYWHPRYLWWTTGGLVLLVGYALSRLPRQFWALGMVGLAVLPIFPPNWFDYRLVETTSPPYRMVLSWFQQHIQPGDVVVIDPNCTCGKANGWDLVEPLYFPNGLPLVDHPGEASRVWYLSTDGWKKDEVLYSEVIQGRKPSIFVGPWYFLLRLYEGPPSWTGAGFGGKVRIHGAQIIEPGPVIAEGQTLKVKLWWSAQVPLDRDYSISLVLLDKAGKAIAQADGPAHAPDTPEPTSQWKPGIYYEDYRSLAIPITAEPGTYTLAVTVYQWWDGVKLTPEKTPRWDLTAANSGYLRMATLSLPGPF